MPDDQYMDLGFTPHADLGFVPSKPKIASKDPTTNSANAALASSGLSVNPPDPIGGAKAPSIWNVRKDAPGMAPTAPPAIPPRGFWQSAIDQVNPIPAVKDYVTNGPNLVRGGNALFQPRMGKDPKTGLPTPSHEFGPSPEDVPFPMGEGPGSSLLGQAAQPLQTAGGQVAEGNYLGGAGTLVGGYGVPAAIPKLAKAAPYAPAAIREGLAGAAEGLGGSKPSYKSHVIAGGIGAAIGELGGVPHGWAMGTLGGVAIPEIYGAAKGAFRGVRELGRARGDQAPMPIPEPARPAPGWQSQGIESTPPPNYPPVNPIVPEDLTTPSGRQVGGPWNTPAEPISRLPRGAPAWQSLETPAQTPPESFEPIPSTQTLTGRKVGGPSAIPARPPAPWGLEGSTQSPMAATPPVLPPRQAATVPSTPTSTPTTVASPSTDMAPILQQSIDAVNAAKKSGQPLQRPIIDPEILRQKQQLSETKAAENRAPTVAAAVQAIKENVPKETYQTWQDPQFVSQLKQAGYKGNNPSQVTLDAVKEGLGLQVGTSGIKPSQAETVMQAVKTGAIPESLLKTGTGGPATPITTPTASGLPASVRATGRPPSPVSTTPVETPTPATRSYKRGAMAGDAAGKAARGSAMRDSAAEKQIMELVSSSGNDAFGAGTGAIGEPLPQILPVLRSKMPKLTDAQFERVVASLADKQKLILHPADTQIDPNAITIGGKKYIAVSLR